MTHIIVAMVFGMSLRCTIYNETTIIVIHKVVKDDYRIIPRQRILIFDCFETLRKSYGNQNLRKLPSSLGHARL